ncbi:MAG: aspartate-semialdehyde dehydrogenase [Alphaproteobacteria bacterium]|nr:aspartate-semialdehyde dehydrogenase [Alphaproteobacteria bacterium]
MQKIAIIGVKENIGYELLNLLSENGFSVNDIIAVEPKVPLGTIASYGEDDELDVFPLESFDFKKADIAIFCCTKEIGKKYLKSATTSNCKVIDLSSASFTMSDVPSIIPELNGDLVTNDTNIIAIPSSCVYQILLPLATTIKNNPLTRLVVNAYISTSHYGRPAMDELFSQSRKIFLNESLADNEQVFKKQIAFNILPQVGDFIGEETELEWQLNAEIKKVLNSSIKVHANAAFVPTFIGDGIFVNAEFQNEIDATNVREDMKTTSNVVVFDKNVDGGYVSVDDIQGEDSIYVSRIRQDVSVENGISFWSVADNLRAGSAKLCFDVLLKYFIKRS